MSYNKRDNNKRDNNKRDNNKRDNNKRDNNKRDNNKRDNNKRDNNKRDNNKRDNNKSEPVMENGKINIDKTIVKCSEELPTITQLRLLLSNAVVVKNKISVEKNKYIGKENYKISEEIEAEIKYLLIKHIYQCGRDDNMKNFDKIFDISNKIKNIGDSYESFSEFYRYLEEIVAYTKYHKE